MYAPFDINVLKENVFNIISHEFFHTQTPQSLHSFELANFNFNNPKFSKHLWLYEGTTEYFTIHMPIKQKMITLQKFVSVIESKIRGMKKYDNTISFTQLSKNAKDFPDEYLNVYCKGPLINLCLDIRLKELSNGAYGVQNLVADLIAKFGPDRPFEDDVLFNEIVNISGFPELETFFENYVEGNLGLPLKEELEKVGLELDTASGDITIAHPISEQQKVLRKQWINQ